MKFKNKWTFYISSVRPNLWELRLGCIGGGVSWKEREEGKAPDAKDSCIDLVRSPEDRFVPKGLGECDWRCWRCNCEGWGCSQWCMKMVWQDAQFTQNVLFQFLLYRLPWLDASLRQSSVLMVISLFRQCILDSEGALKLEVWVVVQISV